MTPREALHIVIEPGLALLPDRMRSDAAMAMLLAIGMQESRFKHRHQMGGPARGFYQFELGGGVRGVLQHSDTSGTVRQIMQRLSYNTHPQTAYTAIEHNDALATVFARLLLWTLPMPLPQYGDAQGGYRQYLEAWRPGRPHPETWEEFYDTAWMTVSNHAA